MSSSGQLPPESASHISTEQRTVDPTAPYEARDVRIGTVVWLMVSIVVGAAIAQWGVWWILHASERWARAEDPALSPLLDPQQVPSVPRLQDTPVRDYFEFERSQESQLHSYGWVDKQQGKLHIPIARSMDLLLERGLPEAAAEATPKEDAQAESDATSSPVASENEEK